MISFTWEVLMQFVLSTCFATFSFCSSNDWPCTDFFAAAKSEEDIGNTHWLDGGGVLYAGCVPLVVVLDDEEVVVVVVVVEVAVPPIPSFTLMLIPTPTPPMFIPTFTLSVVPVVVVVVVVEVVPPMPSLTVVVVCSPVGGAVVVITTPVDMPVPVVVVVPVVE